MDLCAHPVLPAVTTSPHRAFTLVEVLVSLAIFALAAIALSAAYLNVLGAYQGIRQRQQGDEDWKMLRTQVLTEPDRAVLERGGNQSLPDGQMLVWSVRIEPTTIADLFAVTVRMEKTAAAGSVQERSFQLLRPAWSEPGDRDRLRAATAERWKEIAP
jgi:general secretion pathway protein I